MFINKNTYAHVRLDSIINYLTLSKILILNLIFLRIGDFDDDVILQRLPESSTYFISYLKFVISLRLR